MVEWRIQRRLDLSVAAPREGRALPLPVVRGVSLLPKTVRCRCLSQSGSARSPRRRVTQPGFLHELEVLVQLLREPATKSSPRTTLSTSRVSRPNAHGQMLELRRQISAPSAQSVANPLQGLCRVCISASASIALCCEGVVVSRTSR